MPTTRLTIEFETNRKLTTREFLTLAGYLELQISEPWNDAQDQAGWVGENITIEREGE
jgi:hypothetical protein